MLDAPGASLYFKQAGAGPLLLILQGGAGDADGCDLLVEKLADVYTVVTYDRRGLSRSTVTAPEAPVTIATHADDAIRLLEHVGRGPAALLGVSIGALIGLEATARRPELVRSLIAHEPPIASILPEAQRAPFAAHQRELERTFREQGPLAAIQAFMTTLGVDPTDREPDLPPPARGPHVGANLTRMITVDAPAVRQHAIDIEALRSVRDKILPSVGATSRSSMHAEPILALARLLDLDVVTFPGGHGGYASRPAAFAAALCSALATR